jgi:hypothetical protein
VEGKTGLLSAALKHVCFMKVPHSIHSPLHLYKTNLLMLYEVKGAGVSPIPRDPYKPLKPGGT